MIKTILVPATGGVADDAVFASALAVARPFAAHLDFLHVRVDGAAMAVTMSSEGGGSVMVGGLVERLDEEAELRESRRGASSTGFAFAKGWRSPTPRPARRSLGAMARQIGPEPYWVAEHGRAADLIVIGRAADGEGVAPETIETALLESGRPVLIPPNAGMTRLPRQRRHRLEGDAGSGARGHRGAAAAELAKETRILTVAEEEVRRARKATN